LMQTANLEEAALALENSLRSAATDADGEAEAESYELALTLEAVARLSELRGDEDGDARDRSEAILHRLGVVARPTVAISS